MSISSQDSETTSTGERLITAREVEKYLRQHTDFLVQNPSLIDSLEIPGKTEGRGLADLQQYVIEKLRRELGQITRERDLVITRSHHNKLTQDRAHRAVTALISAQNFEHLIDIISSELPLIMGLDAIAIGVEQPVESDIAAPVEGISCIFSGMVDGLIGIGQPVVLRDNIVGDVCLYGTMAPLIRSDALLRLHISSTTPPAMLAFGSQQPDHFEPGQGTELIRFLGSVVENTIRTWLKLPE
ncbi:DUF484 family protein [Kiloniella laminariae]|uniref:DUF484 family protein n=1 Tax=Kiloniella laminariae TaxID=454162 RepID=A0ABT4LMZ2_9PROT|nr:DUF484 family protein [Kiloniella laminariae]MCZ4282449.1 DUF484 family protein [Kiloniella laminariae]